VNPLKPDATTVLVTAGIYRFTRNPMYIGLTLTLLGWAAFLGNLLAFALLPLFVFYITQFQIKPEERALRSLFGSIYEDYCAKVRRWL
jgi:protein-S-isoprenylcysteine O-methyltransferase Ste14